MVLLLKNLLFTFLLPGTVAVYLPLSIASAEPTASAPRLALSGAMFLVGLALYAWCVWDFARFGRGTPAPIDAPRRLVVRGLYRHTRNPMYVGVLTVVLAWAVYYGDVTLALYAAMVATCFHLFVVYYEEPHLAGEFGAQYERYCSRVPRWLPWYSASGV